MKKRLALIMLLFCGCADTGETTTETAVCTTEAVKVPEIATQAVTERTETHASVSTTEERTEERTEEPTEESTGEIDVNGYGWVQLQYDATYNIREDHLTRSNGVVYFMGHRETWYSTNEACGKTTARTIPGKHVAEDGTIRDEDGFICVASSDLAFYSIVMTTVGPGKVYDCGCSSGTVDVYTNW